MKWAVEENADHQPQDVKLSIIKDILISVHFILGLQFLEP